VWAWRSKQRQLVCKELDDREASQAPRRRVPARGAWRKATACTCLSRARRSRVPRLHRDRASIDRAVGRLNFATLASRPLPEREPLRSQGLNTHYREVAGVYQFDCVRNDLER
jgi:hypothetical protein